MVPETPLEPTEQGLVPKGEGWFVLSAREARWYYAPGRSAFCDVEGELDFSQLGINLTMLEPGVPMAMYHWEIDQEDFLVLAGEAVLVIEGEERPLRQWDFVHCPSETKHTIVGAGGDRSGRPRGRRTRPPGRTGLGWLPRRRDRTPPRRGRGTRDERAARGVRRPSQA